MDGMRDDEGWCGERVLVVVAHPDDETFGCGSLIAHAAAAGSPVTVLCATRGEAGSLAPGCDAGGRTVAEIREAELRAAAAVLGARDVRLLGWRDSGMDGVPEPGSLVAAPLAEVANSIRRVIDEVRPEIVVTLDASDGHRDHAHVRDATLQAVDLATWPTARVYLHCLPQALMRSWAEELRRTDPDAPYLALGELGTPPELITTEIDSADLLALRERAIRCHTSQTSPYEQMSPDVRHRFLTVESLRRVRPAWPGGPRERALFHGGNRAPA